MFSWVVRSTCLFVLDNQICGLPSTLKNLRELQSLDISENVYLTQLSATLCYLSHLKDFKFDQDKITYPAKEITSLGIEEIQRWFKKLVGEDFIMDETDAPASTLYPTKQLHSLPAEDTAFEVLILKALCRTMVSQVSAGAP